MKLLVFGATGSIGRQLVVQALEQGHAVTAFARHPSKLTIEHPNLQRIQGDVLDPTTVTDAMHEQDAVLCALGAGRKGIVRSAGTRHIVRAMQQTGVVQLICQTTIGLGDSHGNLNFFWKRIMFGMFLRQAFADHREQEEHIVKSRLDWTIVRPGAFTDGQRTGHYRHGFSGSDRTSKLKIARADVADFMLRQLTDRTYRHQTPSLSY